MPGNSARILIDGPRTHEAMFAAMAGARDHINLQSYILEAGEVGERLVVGDELPPLRRHRREDLVDRGVGRADLVRIRRGPANPFAVDIRAVDPVELATEPPVDLSLDLYFFYVAKKNGFDIRTIDVHFGEREHGESKWAFNWKSKMRNIRRSVTFMTALRAGREYPRA